MPEPAPAFPQHRLLQFAKAPVPGCVKTRLLPALDAQSAAALHARLVRHTLQRLCEAWLAPVQLWVTEPHSFWEALRRSYPEVTQHTQEGDDLGERMHGALSAALDPGVAGAVLVGSDCPNLDAGYLREALRRLVWHDLVLGPAEDGGYVLVGLKQPCRALFEDMVWGRSDVLAITRERAEARGLSVALLPPRADIDRPADLAQLPGTIADVSR